MSCPFYGYAQLGRLGEKILFPTHGNQCGLVTVAHLPCQMEFAGDVPNWPTCGRYDPASPALTIPKAAEKVSKR